MRELTLEETKIVVGGISSIFEAMQILAAADSTPAEMAQAVEYLAQHGNASKRD